MFQQFQVFEVLGFAEAHCLVCKSFLVRRSFPFLFRFQFVCCRVSCCHSMFNSPLLLIICLALFVFLLVWICSCLVIVELLYSPHCLFSICARSLCRSFCVCLCLFPFHFDLFSIVCSRCVFVVLSFWCLLIALPLPSPRKTQGNRK